MRASVSAAHLRGSIVGEQSQRVGPAASAATRDGGGRGRNRLILKLLMVLHPTVTVGDAQFQIVGLEKKLKGES